LLLLQKSSPLPFDSKVECTQRELSAKAGAIRNREVAVFQKETALKSRDDLQRSMAAELDRLRGRRLEVLGPSGAVREFCAGQPDGEVDLDDPGYRRSVDHSTTPSTPIIARVEPIRRQRRARRGAGINA
jgi:hypothetical protein